jgi:hypothetical protein
MRKASCSSSSTCSQTSWCRLAQATHSQRRLRRVMVTVWRFPPWELRVRRDCCVQCAYVWAQYRADALSVQIAQVVSVVAAWRFLP